MFIVFASRYVYVWCVCVSVYNCIYIRVRVCVRTCISICSSTHQFINSSIRQSDNLSIYQSIHPSIHPSINLFVCISLYLFRENIMNILMTNIFNKGSKSILKQMKACLPGTPVSTASHAPNHQGARFANRRCWWRSDHILCDNYLGREKGWGVWGVGTVQEEMLSRAKDFGSRKLLKLCIGYTISDYMMTIEHYIQQDQQSSWLLESIVQPPSIWIQATLSQDHTLLTRQIYRSRKAAGAFHNDLFLIIQVVMKDFRTWHLSSRSCRLVLQCFHFVRSGNQKNLGSPVLPSRIIRFGPLYVWRREAKTDPPGQ